MWNSKHLLMGTGAVAFTLTLLSFSAGNGEPKNKKYHVIHQKDGVLTEYDTILPMTSDYTVAAFLESKGISSSDAKIIEIPALSDHDMHIQQLDGMEHRVIVNHIENGRSENDGNAEVVEIQIERAVNDKGEETIRKTVNGKEVELTEDEKAEIRQEQPHTVWIEKPGKPAKPGKDHQEVELSVQVDENGEMIVKKTVNGKEVEITPEELEEIRNQGEHSDNMQVFFFDGEMSDELENIHIEISEDAEPGTARIVVKEIVTEESIQENGTEDTQREVRVMSAIATADENEDFTIVLVTTDPDEAMTTRTSKKAERGVMNEPISVYPNPNKGTFTVAFNQAEKLPTSVEITDMNGKVVFKDKPGSFSGRYEKEVNLQKYGAGTYVVTVHQGDEVSVRKVIVE